jgi:glycerol-3-phosphate acyltransferase PlsX
MDEQPSVALRKKKDSSIAVGLRLHQQGEVQGFISAGNTGAVVATALFTLGRIKKVKRPAIATYVPTRSSGCVLLDVGANIDCQPSHLFQFAVMGACYAESIMGKPRPRVGLLNLGEESSKGTEAVQQTYQLLKASELEFVGNVEGRDIFAGAVDVVVCDGFVGNVVLKFAESVVDMVYVVMREALTSTLRGRLGGLLLRGAFARLRAEFDYAEYGCAPLLGVNGVCTIAHGSSSVRAIKNAILATGRYIERDVGSAIEERLKNVEQSISEAA